MRLLQIACFAIEFVTAAHAQKNWPVYGGESEGMRYSRLSQISTSNVAKLKLAWQYGIRPANPDGGGARILVSTEAAPIMVGGLLFAPTVNHSIVALEPETGKRSGVMTCLATWLPRFAE